MFADIIIDITHEKLDKVFQYRIPPELEGVQMCIRDSRCTGRWSVCRRFERYYLTVSGKQ